MIDCAICIGGYGDEWSDCETDHIEAESELSCSECLRLIREGETYELVTGVDDEGDENEVTTCLQCAEIAAAFSCKGRVHSNLWADMEAGAFDNLTTACFEKLNTVAAKTFLQERWLKWKGIA